MATKAERKEMQKPDEFQVQASRAMQWIIERKNLLIGAGALVVLVVVAAWGVGAYQASQEAKAGSALSAALALVARPVMGDPGSTQPGVDTFATEDAKTQALQAAFEKVRTDFPGRAAARTAGLQLGFLKLKHGDAAGAQTLLQEYLAQAGADDVLRASAQAGLGAALENQGKLDDAAQAYAKLSEDGAAESAAYQAARLAMLEKKPDAKDLLEKVAKDYPKDPVANEARRALELADLPPPPPPGSEVAPAPAAPAADTKPAPAPGKKGAPVKSAKANGKSK